MPDGRLGEVISVVARRRRWTLEQKLALVEEVSRPGASVAAVADRHGMSRSLLLEWRRQVREGTMPGVERAETAPALVPVRIVEDAPSQETPRLPGSSPTAEAIRYALNHREGLGRFLDDGRIELDTNTVERAIRPIC